MHAFKSDRSSGGAEQQCVAPPVSVDAIIITPELQARPARTPDFEAENRALGLLMEMLSRSSADVLQQLAETSLLLCRAHSAGVSLLDKERNVFVWVALAGQWAPFLGGTMPRDASPCGVAVECRRPILMGHPARRFALGDAAAPIVVEVLLIPFFAADEPVGTLWIVAHDDHRKFDHEDLRLMTNLARFAANAHQLLHSREAERAAVRRLQAKSDELERLAETSAVGLTRVGRDLRYRSVNRAYTEFLGFAREDIVGRTMAEMLGDAGASAIQPYVERVLAGEVVEYEIELTTLKRGPRVAQVNYTPDLDAYGEVDGWIGSIMDITERKRAERTAARTQQERDTLYQLSERLCRATSLDEIFGAALQAINTALRCDCASIRLFDATNVMRFVAWHGLSDAYRRGTEGHSPWSAAERSPEPVRVEDVASAELDARLRATIEAEGIGALAFFPLLADGKLIGKFTPYWNAPRAIGADEVELSKTIARQLAFAIDRQRAAQRLRSQAAQLKLITDTAPVFIAYCDVDARFKFVNQAYANRMGRKPEECTGKRIHEIIGPRAYATIRPYVEKVLRGVAVEFEVLVPYELLGERYMHCSYAPQTDAAGKVIAFVAAVTDVTEHRRAQEELRKSEEKLREADRRKDEFLAMLAHELRNPLAPIANAVHLLATEKSETARQGRARAIIERQTSRLSRLVDDLLEVSRISSGRVQLHLERIMLGAVVERAVETVRPLIEQRRHTLAISVPPQPIWIDGDAARLEQVLVNLLNNAAKYTEDGGNIWLLVECQGEKAFVRVIDTGIGIEPDVLPHVFELFTQAERSLDRASGGLGIGLSLARRLVCMHGGTIDASSTVGHGSEFILRLPLAQTAQAGDAVASADTSVADKREMQPLRVIVVDDNIDAAQSLAMVLEATGHSVTTAHSGYGALEAVRQHRPHVLFLDIGLPELDGFEVAARLRRMQPAPELVIVAITGYGQERDRQRSHAAGIDHHLVKPTNFAQVERILAQVAQSLVTANSPRAS